MIKAAEKLPDVPFPDRDERVRMRLRKKEAVLLAAVRMFNQRGFHASSLEDVATALGITKPVIYHYFGNKDQVLLACVRAGVDQLLDAAEAAKSMPGTGLIRLREFLRRYALVTMTDFGRCVVRTGDEMLSPESRLEFRAIKREVDRSLRHILEEAVADGSAVVDDIRIAAFALAGALNWPARWHKHDGPKSVEKTAEDLADFLVKALLPRPA
ncbi:TetR/AcrR family transcriptional regulator [soil metagenome]